MPAVLAIRDPAGRIISLRLISSSIKAEKVISVPVHGNKALPAGLLNSLLKQAGLK